MTTEYRLKDPAYPRAFEANVTTDRRTAELILEQHLEADESFAGAYLEAREVSDWERM